MKLNEQDIAVLKNFASINQSIQFRAGNVVKTRNESKDLMASAELSDSFPEDFAILDLPRFLSAINLFKDATVQLEFTGENAVRISDGKNNVQYRFTPSSLIEKSVVTDYDKVLPMPPAIVKFLLSWEDLNKIRSAASNLSLPNITAVSANGELKLIAQDSKDKSSDKYELFIMDCDKDFTANFKIETLRFVPDNYEVTITENIVCTFNGSKCKYFVAAEIN